MMYLDQLVKHCKEQIISYEESLTSPSISIEGKIYCETKVDTYKEILSKLEQIAGQG